MTEQTEQAKSADILERFINEDYKPTHRDGPDGYTRFDEALRHGAESLRRDDYWAELAAEITERWLDASQGHKSELIEVMLDLRDWMSARGLWLAQALLRTDDKPGSD